MLALFRSGWFEHGVPGARLTTAVLNMLAHSAVPASVHVAAWKALLADGRTPALGYRSDLIAQAASATQFIPPSRFPNGEQDWRAVRDAMTDKFGLVTGSCPPPPPPANHRHLEDARRLLSCLCASGPCDTLPEEAAAAAFPAAHLERARAGASHAYTLFARSLSACSEPSAVLPCTSVLRRLVALEPLWARVFAASLADALFLLRRLARGFAGPFHVWGQAWETLLTTGVLRPVHALSALKGSRFFPPAAEAVQGMCRRALEAAATEDEAEAVVRPPPTAAACLALAEQPPPTAAACLALAEQQGWEPPSWLLERAAGQLNSTRGDEAVGALLVLSIEPYAGHVVAPPAGTAWPFVSAVLRRGPPPGAAAAKTVLAVQYPAVAAKTANQLEFWRLALLAGWLSPFCAVSVAAEAGDGPAARAALDQMTSSGVWCSPLQPPPDMCLRLLALLDRAPPADGEERRLAEDALRRSAVSVVALHKPSALLTDSADVDVWFEASLMHAKAGGWGAPTLADQQLRRLTRDLGARPWADRHAVQDLQRWAQLYLPLVSSVPGPSALALAPYLDADLLVDILRRTEDVGAATRVLAARFGMPAQRAEVAAELLAPSGEPDFTALFRVSEEAGQAWASCCVCLEPMHPLGLDVVADVPCARLHAPCHAPCLATVLEFQRRQAAGPRCVVCRLPFPPGSGQLTVLDVLRRVPCLVFPEVGAAAPTPADLPAGLLEFVRVEVVGVWDAPC